MKIAIRGLGILILIFSVSVLIYLQSPVSTVTLENYTSVANYEFEFISESENNIIYLYANTDRIEEIENNDLGSIIVHTNNDLNQIFIVPTAVGVEHIKFKDFTTFYYPEYKGYTVIGSIEFDNGVYNFASFLDETKFIYSPNLPVETNTSYREYSTYPIISGVFGCAIMFLTLLDFGSGYDNDKYKQGYKKPQKGKRERY